VPAHTLKVAEGPVFVVHANEIVPRLSQAEYYPGGLRVDVEPGTKWAYSNHGFTTSHAPGPGLNASGDIMRYRGGGPIE